MRRQLHCQRNSSLSGLSSLRLGYPFQHDSFGRWRKAFEVLFSFGVAFKESPQIFRDLHSLGGIMGCPCSRAFRQVNHLLSMSTHQSGPNHPVRALPAEPAPGALGVSLVETKVEAVRPSFLALAVYPSVVNGFLDSLLMLFKSVLGGKRSMHSSGRSLFVYGICLAILGIVMIAIPNSLLSLSGLPTTTEVWIRVAGVLVSVIAFYDVMAGRNNLAGILRWSIVGRASAIVFFSAFVLLSFVKPILILFGAMDLAGAVWTYMALRSER